MHLSRVDDMASSRPEGACAGLWDPSLGWVFSLHTRASGMCGCIVTWNVSRDASVTSPHPKMKLTLGLA